MSDASHPVSTNARWARLTRVLAFLQVATTASALSACGSGSSVRSPGPSCPADQRFGPDATYANGMSIPAEVAAQCDSPGPERTPCLAPVVCVTGEHLSCCGQWGCYPARNVLGPDASSDAAYVWYLQQCSGPQPPPELDS